jgi:acetyltransferase-like isoleucine patch superfamily enzyme
VIQPGVRIGAGALVAAGAVVRKHVAEGTTVSGNPAALRRYDARRALARMGEEV